MSHRPAIPEAVKREVRQQCFFGCIICGSPIWDYDHVVGFAEIQDHSADNLVLLCPTHHAEKTRGMLAIEVVKRFQRAPKNSTDKFSGARSLLRAGIQAALILGGNIIASDVTDEPQPYFTALWVNGETLIGARLVDGFVLFDLTIVGKSGDTILKVSQGEIVISTGAWDVSWVGKRVVIRSHEHAIDASIEFQETAIAIEKGRIVDRLGSGIEIKSKDQFAIVSRGADKSTHRHSVFFGGTVSVAVLNEATGNKMPAGALYTWIGP